MGENERPPNYQTGNIPLWVAARDDGLKVFNLNEETYDYNKIYEVKVSPSLFRPWDTEFTRDYYNWVFTSVAHWGESSKGKWTIKIIDDNEGLTTSSIYNQDYTLNDYRIRIIGTGNKNNKDFLYYYYYYYYYYVIQYYFNRIGN